MGAREALLARRPTRETIAKALRRKPEGIPAQDWCATEELSPEDWRKERGLPNWHNEDEYPSAFPPEGKSPARKTELTIDQWRWEFLRRDTDYWDTWESFSEGKLSCTKAKDGIYNILGADESFRLDEPRFRHLGTYDLSCIIDPRRKAHELPEKFFVRQNQGQRIVKESSGEVTSFLQSGRYAPFVFDVHRPLGHQIARAAARLYDLQKDEHGEQDKLAQRKGKTKHRRGADTKIDDVVIKTQPPKTLQRLLRVLDAFSERAPIKEIGKDIYGYDEKDYNKAQTRMNKEHREALRMWEWL